MNFLAHCLIGAAASDRLPAAEARSAAERLEAGSVTALADELLVGGYLGDFVKGPMPGPLPTSLAAGVRLHRRIDAYSNAHPGIRRSCERFPAELRRLAPVFVDVIADHCLARNWREFHTTPLESFAERSYHTIAARSHWLGTDGQRFLEYMSRTDLLGGYGDWRVAQRGLRSITRRLRREHLDPAIEREVPALLGGLEEDFLDYFPDLLAHAGEWLATAR